MKKTVFIIFILLALIGGVAYYGYDMIFVKGILSVESAEKALGDIDTGLTDIETQGLTEDTIASIESENASSTPTTPATLADIDSAIAELSSFSASDTAGFSTSLSDL